MHDPFLFSTPAALANFVRPISDQLGLVTLPQHIHELLLATLSYTLIGAYLSPRISSWLFPNIYPNFNRRTKLNWDVHVVSLLQSTFINTAALWVMWTDEERGSMGWEERVWGYTGAGGMIQGFAAGYFLWDLGICITNIGVFGWGLLAHAIAALVVFSFGFRPFVNFYGPTFILYELSSPFLNFHWFFDKLQMTGSRPQWYNGILLLSSFFCCRLLWGTYQSIRVYQDVWAGIHFDASDVLRAKAATVFEPLGEADEVMRHAGNYSLPGWLAFVYLASNIVLNTLNFYWFGKMIETVRSRFREPRGGKKQKTEGVMIEGLADSEDVGKLVIDGAGEVIGEIKGINGTVKDSVHATGSHIELERKEVRNRTG